jgi:hypothetical protein
MSFWSQQPRWLKTTTLAYAGLWLLTLLGQAMQAVPEWLSFVGLALSVPLGIVWLLKLRDAKQARTGRDAYPTNVTWAVVGSLLYVAWWRVAVDLARLVGLGDVAAGLHSTGGFGLFFLGLLWVVWWLEKATRQIELQRIDEAQQRGPSLMVSAADESIAQVSKRRIWNPIDPAAWYYGRNGQKLKQSTLAFAIYGLLFWLATVLISQIGGCGMTYEMPAGGGVQKTVAQTVKIQKVIRKKFVVNPFSSIKFDVPPIDEVKLQLQEVTAHQYVIGYGEGQGAGFAGGTSKGKVRLIRLEYDGGDWDLNYGIGGDHNMLIEYNVLTQQKTAEKTEAIRVSQLASFPREKSPPLVFITGQKNLSLANNEVKILREYLIDKHGMIFASSGSQHFHNQFIALMQRVLPDVRPVPVPLDDTIHRVPFAVPTLPYVVPHGGKDALGWSMDGRWLCYYHPGDISDAWADGHAGVSADIYNGCFQLGANVINYGHVEYSKWLQAKNSK